MEKLIPKLLKPTVSYLLAKDFVRFSVVGVTGFLVNLILLTVTHGLLGLHILFAQLISAETALISNFFWHNTWTYKHKNHQHVSLKNKLIKFHMSSWSGIAMSVAIVTLGVEVLNLNYAISLVISAVIVLFWNFMWAKHVIFKSHPIVGEPK